jgi:Icc-related predicted phosphoesterase
MKILVIADIHGKYEALQKIMDAVSSEEFDLILSQGDFTDMFDNIPEFTQLEIADLIIQKLLIPGKELLCVPGNHDPYEIVDVFEEYNVNIHNKKKKRGGITFVGWGGAETPFNTLFEPLEEETYGALSGLLANIKGLWVLVSHAPPKGTRLDTVNGKKHVGSASIRRIIAEKKPVLAVSAHIHENRGTFKSGGTTLFYPGPAYQGFYGLVTISQGGVKCRIKKISV